VIELAYFQLRAEVRASLDFTLLLLEQPNWHNLLSPGQGYAVEANGVSSHYIRESVLRMGRC
jgi:hypothetical protein